MSSYIILSLLLCAVLIPYFCSLNSNAATLENGANVECEPLSPSSKNVLLLCGTHTFTNINGSHTNCLGPHPVGSVIRYKCSDRFVPLFIGNHDASGAPGPNGEEHSITCGTNGQWTKGLSRFQSFLCVEDCGWRKTNPKPLIINGIRSERVSWPWHASIFRRSSKRFRNGTTLTNWEYICGGSIVRNSIVLTAAHCVTTSSGEGLPPEYFKVALGAQTNDFELNRLDSTVQILNVKKVYYIYEAFDPKKDFQADIAVLHLESGMSYNDYVAPVCLPRESILETDALRPGQVGQVAGFGVDETGKVSKYLKYGELLIKSRAECFHSLETKLSDSQFCAGTLKGTGKWTSVCNGDSGGGFVVAAPTHEKYFVNGVVSFANPAINEDDSSIKCQNNAVFTRVLPFMDWIRTVLETIQGDVLKELEPSFEFPFVQKGPAVGYGHKVGLTSWSPEVDAKLSSIQLENMRLNAEGLLKVLSRTKVLHTLNLTDVHMDGSLFQRRVRLPHLKTFVLDLAQTNWDGQASELLHLGFYNSEEESPEAVSFTRFLKSALFFDKEYDEEWPLEEIARLGVYIHFTFNFRRLIHVDPSGGRLMLNQVPFVGEIIANIPPEETFQLRHLHLASCALNLTGLDRRQSGLANSSAALGLQSLVLHDMWSEDTNMRWASQQKVSDITRRCPNLTRLVVGLHDFSPIQIMDQIRQNEVFALYLSHLPSSLAHLALTKTRLSLTRDQLSSTVRPGQNRQTQSHRNQQQKVRAVFPNLSTFVCEDCEIEPALFENLHLHFPHLETLFLKSKYEEFPIEKPLVRFLSKFKNLAKFVLHEHEMHHYKEEYGYASTGSQMMDVMEKRDGNWTRSINPGIIAQKVLYETKLLSTFYTNQPDLHEQRRHTPSEIRALDTGTFVFEGEHRGGGSQVPLTEMFPTLPENVQKSLKSLSVSNVMASSVMLYNALYSYLEFGSQLTLLSLTQIYLLDSITKVAHLPRLQSARINYAALPNIENRYSQDQLRRMIPFTMPRWTGIGLNETSNHTMPSFSIEYDGNILLAWSTRKNIMILGKLEFTDVILYDMFWSLETLVICDSELEIQYVPTSVKFLYLHNVALKQDLALLPTSLTSLRIFEPFKADEEVKLNPFNRFKINLNELSGSEATLLDLGLSGVSLIASSIEFIPSFQLVRKLTLQDFIIEERLLELMWTTLFPNVSKFSISIRPSELELQRPAYERLLLSALNNRKIDWLHATFIKDWNVTRREGGRRLALELSNILSPALVLPPSPRRLETNISFEFTISRLHGHDGEWRRFDEVDGYDLGLHSLWYWHLNERDVEVEGRSTNYVPRMSCIGSFGDFA